jgi:formate dehydrogenase iron-sulfur subunit
MSKYGMLVDLAKCIGCRGCQVACKQWNDMPAEVTRNTGSYQNPSRLSSKTLTLVEFREVETADKLSFVFVKRQCMHCEHPGCATACTVGALQKRPDGPVVYDESKCIGCRYCMYACPFGVPTFQWDKPFALIGKCELCVDRLDAGQKPACAKTCPAGAIQFGQRDELLTIARERVYAKNSPYVKHIYGEAEVGGTTWMYLSVIPFEQLGFPKLPKETPVYLNDHVLHATPTIALGMGLVLSGVYWMAKRRDRIQASLRAENGNHQEEE